MSTRKSGVIRARICHEAIVNVFPPSRPVFVTKVPPGCQLCRVGGSLRPQVKGCEGGPDRSQGAFITGKQHSRGTGSRRQAPQSCARPSSPSSALAWVGAGHGAQPTSLRPAWPLGPASFRPEPRTPSSLPPSPGMSPTPPGCPQLSLNPGPCGLQPGRVGRLPLCVSRGTFPLPTVSLPTNR